MYLLTDLSTFQHKLKKCYLLWSVHLNGSLNKKGEKDIKHIVTVTNVAFGALSQTLEECLPEQLFWLHWNVIVLGVNLFKMGSWFRGASWSIGTQIHLKPLKWGIFLNTRVSHGRQSSNVWHGANSEKTALLFRPAWLGSHADLNALLGICRLALDIRS